MRRGYRKCQTGEQGGESDGMIISQQSPALNLVQIIPDPLTIENCKGIVFNCVDRSYWRDVWRVVDARAGVAWSLSGPKAVK